MADSETSVSRNSSAYVHVTFECVILMSIFPVLLFNRWNRIPNRSREAKRTKYLLLGVFFSNIAFQITSVLRETVCIHGNLITAATYDCRFLLRAVNLIFLIHRAKLAQGMSPILSKKWFEKIFPSIIAFLFVVFVVTVTGDTMKSNFECVSYSDSNVFQYCIDADWESDNQANEDKVTVWIVIILDAAITLSLMILFIVPLYRVLKTDIGVMNNNQLKQRRNLKALLIWSVLLTFINQTTTTLIIIPAAIDMRANARLLALVVKFGKLDPSINVWSSWLMISRNRQFMKDLCCCKIDAGDSQLRITRSSTSGFIVMPSQTGSTTRSRNKSSIEMSDVKLDDALPRTEVLLQSS